MRLVRFMAPRLFVTLFLSEFYRNRDTDEHYGERFMHLLQSKCFREWSSNDTIGDKWVKPKVRLWWGCQAAHQSQSFCKTSFLEIKNMQTFSLSQWRMEANESHQRQINKLINGQLLKLGGHIIPVTITFPGCQALQPLFELSQLELSFQFLTSQCKSSKFTIEVCYSPTVLKTTATSRK